MVVVNEVCILSEIFANSDALVTTGISNTKTNRPFRCRLDAKRYDRVRRKLVVTARLFIEYL